MDAARAAALVRVHSQPHVRLEDISDLVGRSSKSVTGTVYRHEIRTSLTKGATAMNHSLKANAGKPT
jgi:hypothetical protein